MEKKAVVLEFSEIAMLKSDIGLEISKAFGDDPSCLGVCIVKNIPNFVPLRKTLLNLASKFANLPEGVKQKYVHLESVFSFGWSHGKEIMNGKPDHAKGSYYNNPTFESPPSIANKEYSKNFGMYGYANIWPTEELPELQPAFMELGKLIVDVGILLAAHCDRYVSKTFPDMPKDFMTSAIEGSETHKARLLHYFPISANDVEATDVEDNIDLWCGLHIDHSIITGLVSAMFIDESDKKNYKELDKSSPEMTDLLRSSGLYIKGRDNEFIKVVIPDDCLAFQIGEAAQVASRGLLVATPHLVRGASKPFMARNTFAVFLQPNVDHRLTDTITFDSFSNEVLSRHY